MDRPTPEVVEAWVTLYEQTFFNIMTAMVKAESVEDDFAKLQAEARNMTEQQLRKIARYAGEYYVDQANPAPRSMTKTEISQLKARAIRFALKKLAECE